MFEAMALSIVAHVGFPLLVGGLVTVGLSPGSRWRFCLDSARLWLQAYMCGADVSVMNLIGMSFRQVKPSMIVTAKITGRQ